MPESKMTNSDHAEILMSHLIRAGISGENAILILGKVKELISDGDNRCK